MIRYNLPNTKKNDIALALAGVAQCAYCVQKLATDGYIDQSLIETAVDSLFVRDPQNTLEVYGSVDALDTGITQLISVLQDHKANKHSDLIRYMLGILHLQKRLAKRSDVLYIIGNRLDGCDRQRAAFSSHHDNVIAGIAEIYSDTVSKFPYRIQVTGNSNYLKQQRTANQIRTLLLAAIRSATLWRQSGGSRWQFLFAKDKLIATLNNLK